MNIHKTAILDESVSLGKNVEIGAFSQILGNVKIGDNVIIKSNCIIGAEADQPRVDRLGDKNGSIVIEDGCIIKDSVIISKPTLAEVTKIGSNSYLMSGAYIAHDSILGKNVIVSHGARLSGYTTVDNFSNIGANATTHQKTTIGMCVMVGANSFVKGELKILSSAKLEKLIVNIKTTSIFLVILFPSFIFFFNIIFFDFYWLMFKISSSPFFLMFFSSEVNLFAYIT